MFRNYLKIAFRNLKKNKTYAILNVLGLAVGIAASLLIFVVVRFQGSFDDFHPNRDRIYRIGTEYHNEDGVSYSEGVSFPVAPALRIDFPQIKQVAGIFKRSQGIVSVEDELNGGVKKFSEEEVYYAEPGIFGILNFTWLAGKPATALKDPFSIAISQAIAIKYFGDWKSAMGKTIKFNNKDNYKVTGIIQDVPQNSDFPLELVASYTTLRSGELIGNLDDWVSTYGGAEVFVVLPEQMTKDQFNAGLKTFAKKHRPAEYAKDIFVAQSFDDIHYDDRFGNFRWRTFSRQLIFSLTLIAIFLIVIACVNFINLATAQAVNRSKEVGVRKVLGSSRWQLALQFLSETMLITGTAIALAICIAAASLPFLNKLLNVTMVMNFIQQPSLLVFVVVTMFAVTLLSGLYPALIVSGFNPITALKNKISAKSVGGISLRRVLVILQFSVAHVLIICTLIVVSQTDYFRTASLGFDKDAIINVPVPGDSISHTRLEHLRNDLLQNPQIQNVSFSFSSPSDHGNWNSDFKFDHAEKSTDFSANLKWADPEYFKTYKLHFVAGRPYFPSDTVREFVVNETLLRKVGITDPKQAIGKELSFWDGKMVARIVGVVNDFNSYSLRDPMAPVVMSTYKDVYQLMNIRLGKGSEKQVLSYIEKAWTTAFPDYVYKYEFLDKKIDGFYHQENQLSTLYKLFAGIAIFISCLGLYGLVSFMAVKRMKEVGIRKVLGASVGNIVYLFSRELTILILAAFVLAAPVAYYLMHKWLQDFTYRIPLGVGVFVFAILGSLIIAWLTVGYRSLRAAVVNPVKSLKTE